MTSWRHMLSRDVVLVYVYLYSIMTSLFYRILVLLVVISCFLFVVTKVIIIATTRVTRLFCLAYDMNFVRYSVLVKKKNRTVKCSIECTLHKKGNCNKNFENIISIPNYLLCMVIWIYIFILSCSNYYW